MSNIVDYITIIAVIIVFGLVVIAFISADVVYAIYMYFKGDK